MAGVQSIGPWPCRGGLRFRLPAAAIFHHPPDSLLDSESTRRVELTDESYDFPNIDDRRDLSLRRLTIDQPKLLC